MSVNDLIEFHRGDFKSDAFLVDLLDECFGFDREEIENLQRGCNSVDDFIRNMNEETWWVT